MNRVHELGKRSRAFGQPREVQPFLIILVAFFFRADQSASSHPTTPVDPDLQKGVNEVLKESPHPCFGDRESQPEIGLCFHHRVARQYQVLISHPKERSSEDLFDISFKRE